MALQVGIRTGLYTGLWSGLDTVYPAGGITVATDGPGAVYVPASSADFSQLSITTPDSLWLLQDASGNPASAIGAVTPTAAGVASYSNAVTSWTRVFYGFSEASTNQRVGVALGTYNPATASQSALVYAKVETVSAASRILFGVSAAIYARYTAGGLLQIVNNGSAVTGTYDYRDGNVHPYLLRYNLTNSTVTLFTDKEQLSPVFTTGIDVTTKGLGAVTSGATTPVCKIGYWAHWAGASAEAVGKPTLVSLGWSMAY